MRIVSRCGAKMLAWVRESGGKRREDGAVKVDVDLCDAAGQVCVEMRGVSWEERSDGKKEGVEKAQAVAMYQAVAGYEEDKAGVQAVERVRREIVLRPGGEKKGGEKKGGEKKGDGVEASKPRGVLLAEIESSGVEKVGAVEGRRDCEQGYD